MNPVERVIRRVDTTQQRFRAPAFVFGVVKKFGDDNGGVLVGNLAHSGLVALFPLLLVLVTFLGLVASGDASLRLEVLNAVARQFPQIGSQLAGNVHALRRSSVIGLIIGLAALIWGASGLAQAGLFTMAQVWNLPGPARPGYVQRLGRAMLFLGTLGLGVIVTTLLTGLEAFGHKAVPVAVGVELLAVLANISIYLVAFRVLTPKGVPIRKLLAGAIAGGVAWTLLQALGGYLIHHYLRSDSVYGVFATVLGLVAWIYLSVEIAVYAAEVNVVLARRLWPRSIVQPPLTEADRATMALQALQNQRREEEQVTVSFDDRTPGASSSTTTPRTPDDVSPPARDPAEDPQSRAAVVVNPTKHDDREKFRATVCAAMSEHGWREPLWLETTIDDPGEGLARAAVAEGADLVLASGGDGTVTACAAGVAGTGVPLAVLPAGTGNLLARNLGLPLDLGEALAAGLGGTDRPLDMGTANGKPFLVMAGIGFDANMLDSTSESLKKRLGWTAYGVSALRHLRDRPMRVSVSADGGPPLRRRASAVVIGNVGALQGGVPLLPDAEPDDGQLDVLVLTARGVTGWMALAGHVLLRRHRATGRVARLTFRELRVDLDREHLWQLDGEVIGTTRELVVTVQAGALLLRGPASTG